MEEFITTVLTGILTVAGVIIGTIILFAFTVFLGHYLKELLWNTRRWLVSLTEHDGLEYIKSSESAFVYPCHAAIKKHTTKNVIKRELKSELERLYYVSDPPDNLEFDKTCTISTKIKDEHVLVLDVDDYDSMLAAIVSLSRRNIKFQKVESSPGRHWIITNYVGPIDKVLKMLALIPGVDENYVKMCRALDIICLRCHSKFQRINRQQKMYRIKFPEGSSLNGKAKEWYDLFKNAHQEMNNVFVDKLIEIRAKERLK